MKQFTDSKKRRWDVSVTVAAIKRVRTLLEVDLLDILGNGELITKLVTDPVLLVDVLYVMCKPQADEQGVSDEQFGEAMAGEPINDATRALLEDLANFSPNPAIRKNMRRVVEAAWKAEEKAGEVLTERLDGGELEKIVDRAVKSANESFGDAPESSDSTPDP